MCLFVGCQITRLREALVAAWIVTHIWFLSSVSSKMCPQIEVKREPFIAQGAFEWLLAGMD